METVWSADVVWGRNAGRLGLEGATAPFRVRLAPSTFGISGVPPLELSWSTAITLLDGLISRAPPHSSRAPPTT
jgi:hypothetical protein